MHKWTKDTKFQMKRWPDFEEEVEEDEPEEDEAAYAMAAWPNSEDKVEKEEMEEDEPESWTPPGCIRTSTVLEQIAKGDDDYNCSAGEQSRQIQAQARIRAEKADASEDGSCVTPSEGDFCGDLIWCRKCRVRTVEESHQEMLAFLQDSDEDIVPIDLSGEDPVCPED